VRFLLLPGRTVAWNSSGRRFKTRSEDKIKECLMLLTFPPIAWHISFRNQLHRAEQPPPYIRRPGRPGSVVRRFLFIFVFLEDAHAACSRPQAEGCRCFESFLGIALVTVKVTPRSLYISPRRFRVNKLISCAVLRSRRVVVPCFPLGLFFPKPPFFYSARGRQEF